MNRYESIGYIASMLVLAAFCVRGVLALRVLAVASNLAFMTYALLAGLQPVLLLHVLLLPLNAWRLYELVRAGTSSICAVGPKATPVASLQCPSCSRVSPRRAAVPTTRRSTRSSRAFRCS